MKLGTRGLFTKWGSTVVAFIIGEVSITASTANVVNRGSSAIHSILFAGYVIMGIGLIIIGVSVVFWKLGNVKYLNICRIILLTILAASDPIIGLSGYFADIHEVTLLFATIFGSVFILIILFGPANNPEHPDYDKWKKFLGN